MNLFQHAALGGAIVVTDAPRYQTFTPGTQPASTVATFTNDDGGRFALECFKNGLALRAVGTISLFDEEAGQYLIGSVDQLDIAPAA